MDIETPRLALRPLRKDDAPWLHALWNEPAVAEALFVASLPITQDRVDGWVAGSVEEPPRVFVVSRDGRAVGYCGIQPLAGSGEPELFYGYSAASWGHGVATEAAVAVLAHARDALKLPRVVAITLPANARSIRVIEKLGFSARGETTHAGRPHARFELELAPTSS